MNSKALERLEKELGKDDYEKLRSDIKQALLDRKKEFFTANYLTSKNAKTKLMTLVTEIMMDKAEYIIDEILQDCKRQKDLLKIERDRLKQHQDHLDIKTSEHNKSNNAADKAKQELAEALQEELKSNPAENEEDEPKAF